MAAGELNETVYMAESVYSRFDIPTRAPAVIEALKARKFDISNLNTTHVLFTVRSSFRRTMPAAKVLNRSSRRHSSGLHAAGAATLSNDACWVTTKRGSVQVVICSTSTTLALSTCLGVTLHAIDSGAHCEKCVRWHGFGEALECICSASIGLNALPAGKTDSSLAPVMCLNTFHDLLRTPMLFG